MTKLLDVTEPRERTSVKQGGPIRPTSADVKARSSRLPQKVGKCKPLHNASEAKRRS